VTEGVESGADLIATAVQADREIAGLDGGRYRPPHVHIGDLDIGDTGSTTVDHS
jgi:hypothetical protein